MPNCDTQTEWMIAKICHISSLLLVINIYTLCTHLENMKNGKIHVSNYIPQKYLILIWLLVAEPHQGVWYFIQVWCGLRRSSTWQEWRFWVWNNSSLHLQCRMKRLYITMGKLIELTRWRQNAFLIAIVQIEGKQKLVTCLPFIHNWVILMTNFLFRWCTGGWWVT
jgi:hypothetical protein